MIHQITLHILPMNALLARLEAFAEPQRRPTDGDRWTPAELEQIVEFYRLHTRETGRLAYGRRKEFRRLFPLRSPGTIFQRVWILRQEGKIPKIREGRGNDRD